MQSSRTASCSLPSSSLKYVYCTDNVLDCANLEAKDITGQSLQLDTDEIIKANQTPRKEAQTGYSSAMNSPNKMDAESRL